MSMCVDVFLSVLISILNRPAHQASSPVLTVTHSIHSTHTVHTRFTHGSHGSHGSHAGGGECDKPRKRIHVVVDTKGEFGGDEHNDRPFKAKPFIVRVHFEEELDVVLNQF